MKSSLAKTFSEEGILAFDCPFLQGILNKWNRLLDPYFEGLKDQSIAAIPITQLDHLGIFDEFMDSPVLGLIREIMPDAIITSFEAQEIKANQEKSHVRGDILEGWHLDIDPELDITEKPHYVSIFIYLTDVSPTGGGFEIMPGKVTPHLANGTSCIKMHGTKGTSFVWNRRLFHRGSPNHDSIRRRSLKIEFQNNFLENQVVRSPEVKNLLSAIANRPGVKNKDFKEFFLGSKHQGTHKRFELPETESHDLNVRSIKTNSRIKVSSSKNFYNKIIRRVNLILHR